MKTPWIENYRGEWANSEGFEIMIGPIDEKRASVEISLNGLPILRPWCADSPCENLNAVYREDEGGGLEVGLGRDGFSLFLDYECVSDMYERKCLTAGISRYEDDQEAERWTSFFGLKTYFPRTPNKITD
jgi:hypothetical protein